MGTILRPLVAAALLAAGAPALAVAFDSSAKVTINTGDIDLTSPSGRERLDRRVENAINTICGTPIYGTRQEAEELRACRSEARAAVQPQLRAVGVRAAVNVSDNR